MIELVITILLFPLVTNTVQWLLTMDQWLNTYWYIPGDGWGYADEAISARAFRCYVQGLISDVPMFVIDAMFFWQQDHCFHAWRAEFDRRQLPDHYRLEQL